jgi:hypothetical protein
MTKDLRYKKRKIVLKFWEIISKNLDPEQGEELERIPVIMKDKGD